MPLVLRGRALLRHLFSSALTVIIVLAAACDASAQGMYLKEVAKDGRIYVFNIAANAERFEKTGETGTSSITMVGSGPNGETVIGDNAKALQLYFFKHGLPVVVPDPPPAWKISGLVFGDYYAFADDHLPEFDGQHAMWLRRAYFTYDHTFSPTVTTRLRFEANGNGQLEGGLATAYVKDAYLRWTFYGQQQLTIGIQPSLTFDGLEPVWGLRHIEKTPLDLYRWDSSRDTGFAVSGPINESKTLNWAVQAGNDSGQSGETDQFKGYRGAFRYERNPGIAIEGMAGYFNRAGEADRTTAQVFAAYRAVRGRAAVQYSFQHRSAAEGSGAESVDMSLLSAFGVYDIKPQKYSTFIRVDRHFDPCRDCGGIDYLPIDPTTAFTLVIAGFEYFIHPSVRLSPNIEWVAYSQPATGPPPKDDVVARLTFYWVW